MAKHEAVSPAPIPLPEAQTVQIVSRELEEAVEDDDDDDFDDSAGDELDTSGIDEAHVDDATWLTFAEAFRRMRKRAKASEREGRAILLCGPTGSGKSHVLDRVENAPTFVPIETDMGIVRTLVRVDAPAPCTLKTLGTTIYRELTGVDLRSHIQEHEIWNRVRAQLAAQKVKYLMIDELNHVLLAKSVIEHRKVAETFKRVMQMKDWKVYLILAGMPESLPFLRGNGQLNRRTKKIEIRPVVAGDVGNAAIATHVKILIEKLGTAVDFDLAEAAPRFHLASGGYLGKVAELLKNALEVASDAGGDHITLGDLAEAYDDLYGASTDDIGDEKNPFLCTDHSLAMRIVAADNSRETKLKGKRSSPQRLEAQI
ncbi:ATP-binding protein [Aureimonas jatrophae]|uniref:Type II secretory pathway, component ExeA (Predicted ATPase) n=1 Tax=Aureimonas jatrophae TaxID=1166073 RepID=A0A1H0JCR2_9HYPH|nr:ATP-binding protein [Aureimonas jatrophae]MBB3951472.1 type II secretory pathway predicted ATPase ExeA [Aureimonas jatrophae]SDO41527.1 Type II secretory pathway, component ExeA (predicted ATPase) [Aureimonas jatrophae]